MRNIKQTSPGLPKSIVITGASSGLGYGMAKLFAQRGYRLGLCARRVDRLEQLKADILKNYPEADITIKHLDVSNIDEIQHVFYEFKTEFGVIDRIIVNAGVGNSQRIGDGGLKENLWCSQINFSAVIAQSEYACEIFRAQNHGHLVSISSMSAFMGIGGSMTVYAATKAAVASLNEGIRKDFWNTPVKITTLYPGFIQSEMTDKYDGKKSFMVSLDKGVKAMVNAIEQEVDEACVPRWPWEGIKIIMRHLPTSIMQRIE